MKSVTFFLLLLPFLSVVQAQNVRQSLFADGRFPSVDFVLLEVPPLPSMSEAEPMKIGGYGLQDVTGPVKSMRITSQYAGMISLDQITEFYFNESGYVDSMRQSMRQLNDSIILQSFNTYDSTGKHLSSHNLHANKELTSVTWNNLYIWDREPGLKTSVLSADIFQSGDALMKFESLPHYNFHYSKRRCDSIEVNAVKLNSSTRMKRSDIYRFKYFGKRLKRIEWITYLESDVYRYKLKHGLFGRLKRVKYNGKTVLRFKYGKKGRFREITSDAATIKFNAQGLPAKREVGDGGPVGTFKYEYDDKGNWVVRRSYVNNVLAGTEERVIKYYE